jgi:hypothetical protein
LGMHKNIILHLLEKQDIGAWWWCRRLDLQPCIFAKPPLLKASTPSWFTTTPTLNFTVIPKGNTRHMINI